MGKGLGCGGGGWAPPRKNDLMLFLTDRNLWTRILWFNRKTKLTKILQKWSNIRVQTREWGSRTITPPPEYATGYITLKCIATHYLITLFCPHKLTYAIYLTIRVAALDQYINECLNIIKNMTWKNIKLTTFWRCLLARKVVLTD